MYLPRYLGRYLHVCRLHVSMKSLDEEFIFDGDENNQSCLSYICIHKKQRHTTQCLTRPHSPVPQVQCSSAHNPPEIDHKGSDPVLLLLLMWRRCWKERKKQGATNSKMKSKSDFWLRDVLVYSIRHERWQFLATHAGQARAFPMRRDSWLTGLKLSRSWPSKMM